MKSKTITRQRTQERRFDINDDLKKEFGEILDDSIVDELAMAEVEDED